MSFRFPRLLARRWLLLAAVLGGGAEAAERDSPAPAASPPQAQLTAQAVREAHAQAQPAAQDAPRQILVMLHLPAPHYRPDAYYPSNYRADAGSAARRRTAEALAREYGLQLLEDWAMPALNVDCFRMAEPADAPPGRIVEALSRDPRVKWAQPIQTFSVQGANDPLYPVQPVAQQWQLADVRKAATGRKVTVAVIDSGVETEHPDLAGQVSFKENFVDGQSYAAETHGTGVAGVIAARAGNGVGIEGVAPDARLMALRACWQGAGGGTLCNSFTLAKAMNFALMHGAQVINLSLSGPPDRLLAELIDVACARGVRVVSAVDPASADGGFPASHPGVFAVSASGAKGAGARVLQAPGRDIPTAAPGARWGLVNGASYSAAHISGMMALLSELRPGMALPRLRASIVSNGAGPAQAAGVDLCATVTHLTGKCTCSCNSANGANGANTAQLNTVRTP
ncbi:S8 family peptidase [Pseudoduganella namucuonensis]|uniref:Subtilase family protein n=1 Tax=Pseudoduganella namucuonensis TaxID=1035707 RepID=A0A1I7KT98_9BURK|nr:S8 family serine peptidase [Pseudoduganella namucuonensis]SFV00645.1 Subtilase family protein [Pseudoduganella namucuonensis]